MRSPLASHERPVRLADPGVDLRDPAAEFGDQVALGGKPFRESQRLVEPLDGRLIVVPVEGHLPQILQRDHALALESVFLGLGERASGLPVGGAKIAADAEEPRADEARLDLPSRMASLAVEESRAVELGFRPRQAAQLQRGDARVQGECGLFVIEPGFRRLLPAPLEFSGRAMEFAGAEEAEAEEVPRAEHAARVLEVPSADVIGRAEVLFSARGPSKAPGGAAGRDVEFEDGALVVGPKRIELLELLFGALGHLSPAAEPEERAAADEKERRLQLLPRGVRGVSLGDAVERVGEPGAREEILEPRDQGFRVALRFARFGHGQDSGAPGGAPDLNIPL